MSSKMSGLALLMAGTAAAVLAIWLYRPCRHTGTCEVEIVGGNSALDAAFRARCVCVDIFRRESLERMAEHIRNTDKELDRSIDELITLLASAKMSVRESSPVIVSIEVVGDSQNVASRLAGLFGDEVVRRIGDDEASLKKTMEKWFDNQIYHMRKRHENVSRLESEKIRALDNVSCTSLKAKVRK